jgi:hypothetical protein
MRIVQSILALLLLAAAIPYAAATVGLSFIGYLSGLNWQWMAFAGLSGVAALASVVLAFNLLFRPTKIGMYISIVLLIPAIFIVAHNW